MTALFIICIFLLMLILIALVGCYLRLKNISTIPTASVTAVPEGTVVIPEEDYKNFLRADAQNTQDFYSTLSALNSFMTGTDMEVTVDEQDN